LQEGVGSIVGASDLEVVSGDGFEDYRFDFHERVSEEFMGDLQSFLAFLETGLDLFVPAGDVAFVCDVFFEVVLAEDVVEGASGSIVFGKGGGQAVLSHSHRSI
jgi:hypothetical protein